MSHLVLIDQICTFPLPEQSTPLHTFPFLGNVVYRVEPCAPVKFKTYPARSVKGERVSAECGELFK